MMTKMLTTASDMYDRMSESLNDHNNIKYMPYRIALKLIVLQKYTCCKCTLLCTYLYIICCIYLYQGSILA